MEQQKQAMRIALVGIMPADQVTMKGYFRVLLRLDVALEWVEATFPDVDLFIIGEEFRHAQGVVKLLSGRSHVPVLYITKNAPNELKDNVLSLPLRQTALLHKWLLQNIDLLQRKAPPVDEMLVATAQPQAPSDPVLEETPVSVFGDDTLSLEVADVDYSALVTFAKTLSNLSDGIYKITYNNQTLAIIDRKNRKLWAQANRAFDPAWRLEVHHGQGGTGAFFDMHQWLWEKVIKSKGYGALLTETNMHKIAHWVRPDHANQRALVAIMTAIEKVPKTPEEIANATGLPLMSVRDLLASLLLCGALLPPSYQTLQAPTHKIKEAPKPKAPPVDSAPKPKPEKLSMWAKLRRKLGL